jgi:hypothetical protein
MKDLQAETSARKLLEHFGRWGTPMEIKSDNGSDFVSNLQDELFKQSGIPHLKSIPHSHQENSRVERANKEVLRHIRAFCFDNQCMDDWSSALPMAQRIINTTRNEITGVTPADLRLGSTADLDRFVLDTDLAEGVSGEKLSKWISATMKLQETMIKTAARLQAEKDKAHTEANAETEATVFPIGSWVLVEYPTNDKVKGRPPTKLMLHRKGPLQVVKRNGDEYTDETGANNSRFQIKSFLVRSGENGSREVGLQRSRRIYS